MKFLLENIVTFTGYGLINKMNVAIIMGHPNKDSYCAALADAYKKGSEAAGNKVKVINVIDMKFNALEQVKNPEKDVLKAQETIAWADHVVWVTPIWWSTTTALLKGFIDRVLTVGFSYKFISNMKWEKLLKGKTSRVIATMGAPAWAYRCFMGNPLKKNMKGTLDFCGFKTKYTYVDKMMRLTDADRKDWLKKMEVIAMKD